jgi:ABC-type transport system involved in multi-copper enzyme maturation permease subunit
MAVYKRSYSAYSGALTAPSSRVLVVARYAFAEAWSSKITIGLFILCMLSCLVSLFGIYFANNEVARELVGSKAGQILTIDASYFLKVLQGQAWLALVLASWVAPRLISFDLTDNALPILLSHPISRLGYLGGKFLALIFCLSVVTWVPCLLLFAYQGYSAAVPWIGANLRIAFGLFAGSVLWIFFLSVLGLAMSSWVKWRVVATGSIFAALLVPAGFGAIVSAVLRTRWGFLLNLPMMITLLWRRLLGVQVDFNERFSLPTPAIVAMLVLVCLLCFAMLNKRIRAREVVRG